MDSVMFTVLRNGDRTEFAHLIDVLREATADDPVYVATRGWMTVGDLRWETTPEPAAPRMAVLGSPPAVRG
jgi:hypothetical protein